MLASLVSGAVCPRMGLGAALGSDQCWCHPATQKLSPGAPSLGQRGPIHLSGPLAKPFLRPSEKVTELKFITSFFPVH